MAYTPHLAYTAKLDCQLEKLSYSQKDNKKILYNPIIFTVGTTDAWNHVVTLMVNKTVLANRARNDLFVHRNLSIKFNLLSGTYFA